MTARPGDNLNRRRASRPALASPAALAMLAALEAARATPAPVVDLPTRRRDLQSAYKPRIERAIARHAPRLSETVIAEVPCLEVLPQGDPLPGAVLYCFGGAHVTGDPWQDMSITAALARYLGRRVVVPSYRLSPEHPCPAALDDCTRVYRAMVDGEVAVVGESAGGTLALGVMQRARRNGLAMPVAAGLLSPWCDLTPGVAPPDEPSDPTLDDGHLEMSAGRYAGGRDLRDPEVSPLYGAFDRSFPPTLITTGTRDRFRRDCEALADTLEAADVPVQIEIWRDLWHVFEFYDEVPEAEQSLQEIATFLGGHFSRG